MYMQIVKIIPLQSSFPLLDLTDKNTQYQKGKTQDERIADMNVYFHSDTKSSENIPSHR